ncbi:ligand-binding sensor domain-containing protein [Algoriphagus pacificus]|uniref:Histidine kinase n=1 Tax=Algoriphagus pacificus TaxID=2811234 RepID=A0ABS3CEK0_9BACT|nr:two-component regulator propeller domain-containing protein [Algoriphagus pacificus]MBN7814591.1 histidine kinase [Algoriphagus pacificus]
MIKYISVYALFLLVVSLSSCGQKQMKVPKETPTQVTINPEIKEVITSNAPNSITRTIEQDRNGNIWIATFKGVFQYDGKSFTNMTSEVSSARFFSVLEDREGNIWLGSIGSGVYYYDGKSYKNFTTKDGLVNNEVTSIYEDKTGNIWFGVNGGVSRYDPSAALRTDGKSFLNYLLIEDSLFEDKTGKTVPDFTRPPNEVTSIIEDKTGKFWFGTRGSTFVFDGKTFTAISYNGKPFKNVRTIIEDTKGNIWLGGNDGLWQYDGNIFTNFSQNFVGYIIEDSKGNIWTSSEGPQGWVLSQYDEKSLSHRNPIVTEINPNEGRMLFGIFEANDGNIWFGSNGVSRYDTRPDSIGGNTITHFKADSINQF